ncbi:MAG: extracellular solute-binding protein [Treponema sp.]|nr:extracellular solute-binding protein [Treponema sp.]
MKKLVTGLCLLLVAATLFAAPKAKKNKKAKKSSVITLNVMGYGDNSNAEGQTFKRICDEFMAENPDIKINYELLYDEAYHQKAVSRLAAGDVPDIAYMGADARWGSEWQEAGQQIDNLPFYPANVDASLVPDFFGTGVKPYLPLGGSNYCTVVAVNMNLLNKIGGKIPETYEDMKALAKLCKANGIELMSTHGADGWVWGSCVMSGIIPRTTGDLKWIEKAVNKQVKFTDKGFVEALSVLSTWVADGVLDPNSVLTDNGTGMSNFVNGKYLMYIDGQWAFGESNLGDLSKSVKLISIPQVPGEKACAGSLAGAWQVGYGITKKGASDPAILEAAKKWLAYYNSYDEVVQRLRDGGISAPILKDFVLPSGMDPCIGEKAKLGAYPSCFVIDSYLTGVANDTLNAGMQDIVSGKIDAATLAANVQKAFDAQ